MKSNLLGDKAKSIISYFSMQLDCGIHPGLHGLDALPYVDLIEPEDIDVLLITQ